MKTLSTDLIKIQEPLKLLNFPPFYKRRPRDPEGGCVGPIWATPGFPQSYQGWRQSDSQLCAIFHQLWDLSANILEFLSPPPKLKHCKSKKYTEQSCMPPACFWFYTQLLSSQGLVPEKYPAQAHCSPAGKSWLSHVSVNLISFIGQVGW